MNFRTLGTRGPSLSAIGLGCNNFGLKLDQDASVAVVHAALDADITHFDTAESYGGGGRSEEHLGVALKGVRDRVAIATKYAPRPQDEAYSPGALAARIRKSCDGSLQRLGTDRIDVYYQHRPDPDAPIDEVLEALGDLVTAGKVLHVASSNDDADQIRAADAAAGAGAGRARFCGTQIEWNLLARDVERSTVPAAREHGLGIVPYFPLSSGMLTGKYRRDAPYPPGSRFDVIGRLAKSATDENFDRVERLTTFAEQRGHSILELAIAWLVAQEGVTSVIAGATTPEQVAANAAAARWELTDDDLAAVDELLS